MRYLIIYILVLLVFMVSNNACYAGKIKNLNINAKDNSKVEVKTGENSEIDNVKIKKDKNSKVIIDGKEVDCAEVDPDKGICSPDMMF